MLYLYIVEHILNRDFPPAPRANQNYSRIIQTSLRVKTVEEGKLRLRVKKRERQRRQNGSTRRMIRAKCVVSRVQPCQLTPVLAARQAFDQGTGRPSNEGSPPLLPWYLHYFCGVIKNPVPGVGQRIRQPLSLRRPCFLFAMLNVNESFSPLFIFFSLPYILCIGLFLYSGLRKYSNIYRSHLWICYVCYIKSFEISSAV